MGAVVILEVPRAQVPGGPLAMGSAANAVRRVASSKAKHVLVVEDDAYIRDLIDSVLSDQGYRVTVAEDGAQGLEKCKQDPPDLILLDLLMPGLDGHEFLRRMQSGHACRAPVIIVSALHEARRAAEAIGGAPVLAKPFTIDQLLAAVQEHAA